MQKYARHAAWERDFRSLQTPCESITSAFFQHPSCENAKIQVPQNNALKAPCFAEEKAPDDENMRRALGESAIFVPYKTQAKMHISIFAPPLMRKR